jgi:hypothetical protein
MMVRGWVLLVYMEFVKLMVAPNNCRMEVLVGRQVDVLVDNHMEVLAKGSHMVGHSLVVRPRPILEYDQELLEWQLG